MLSPPAQTSVKSTSAGSPESPRRTLTSWTSVDSRLSAKTRRSRGGELPDRLADQPVLIRPQALPQGAGTSGNRRMS